MGTITIKVRVDVDDVLEELTDSRLLEEAKERGIVAQSDVELDEDEKELNEFSISEIAEYLSDLPCYNLRDLFCDMVGVNHHTPKDELMKLLSEKI